MKETTKAHLMIGAATLLISTSFPVVAEIAGSLDSLVLTLLRFVLASLLFLPIVLVANREQLVPTGRSFVRYAVLSAPLVGFFLAMFEALRTSTAINTGALATFGPGFAALFAFMIVRERLGGRRVLALVTGMVGALWVVFRGDPSRVLELELIEGDWIFLAGTASLGLYAVLIQLLHRGEPTAVMTFWTLVTGSLWLLAFGWSDLGEVDWPAVEPRVFLWIAYLAFFTTLLSFFLNQKAVTVLGPTRTMAYSYLNPGLVALLAWWLGQEAIGWRALPGIALTLVSMLVLQRRAAPRSA